MGFDGIGPNGRSPTGAHTEQVARLVPAKGFLLKHDRAHTVIRRQTNVYYIQGHKSAINIHFTWTAFFPNMGVYLVEMRPRKSTLNDSFRHVRRGSIVPVFISITGHRVVCAFPSEYILTRSTSNWWFVMMTFSPNAFCYHLESPLQFSLKTRHDCCECGQCNKVKCRCNTIHELQRLIKAAFYIEIIYTQLQTS